MAGVVTVDMGDSRAATVLHVPLLRQWIGAGQAAVAARARKSHEQQKLRGPRPLPRQLTAFFLAVNTRHPNPEEQPISSPDEPAVVLRLAASQQTLTGMYSFSYATP